MKDLLSSASLILAVIGFLHNTWASEIKRVSDFKTNRRYLDAKQDHSELKTVLLTRAAPLFISALLMLLIFAPDAIKTIKQTSSVLFDPNINGEYDAISATFLFIELTFFGISLYFGQIVWKLIDKHRKFVRKRREDKKITEDNCVC